jgi:hypothetical protein
VLGGAILLSTAATAVEYVIEKVALEGDTAPQATGTYESFSNGISLNVIKDVGYTSALLGGPAGYASWVAHKGGGFDVVLTTDTPPTGSVEQFTKLGVPRLNDAGEFALGASLNTAPSHHGWFAHRQTGLELVVRVDDPVPGMPGITFKRSSDRVKMLSTGEVLLGSTVSGNPQNGSGVFIIGATSTDIVVTNGAVMPVAGSPTFTWVAPEADANSSGDVAFYGEAFGITRGIFVRRGGSLTAVAVEGDPAPGSLPGTLNFGGTHRPSIKQVASCTVFTCGARAKSMSSWSQASHFQKAVALYSTEPSMTR